MTKQNITMNDHKIVVVDWSKVSNPAEVEVVLLDTIDRGLYRASGRNLSTVRDDLNTLYRLLEKQPAKGITRSFRQLLEELVDDFNKTPARSLNVAMLDNRKLTKSEFDEKSSKKRSDEDDDDEDDAPKKGKSKGKRSDKDDDDEDDAPKKGKSGGNAFTKSDLSDLFDKKLGPITGVLPTKKGGKKFAKVASKKDLDELDDKVTGLKNRLGKKNKKGTSSGGASHPFNYWGGLLGLIAFAITMIVAWIWIGAVFSFALVLAVISGAFATLVGSALTGRN